MPRSKHYRLRWYRVEPGWYRACYDGLWFHVKDAEIAREWFIYISEDKYSTGGTRNYRGFDQSCRFAKWEAERAALGEIELTSLAH